MICIPGCIFHIGYRIIGMMNLFLRCILKNQGIYTLIGCLSFLVGLRCSLFIHLLQFKHLFSFALHTYLFSLDLQITYLNIFCILWSMLCSHTNSDKMNYLCIIDGSHAHIQEQ